MLRCSNSMAVFLNIFASSQFRSKIGLVDRDIARWRVWKTRLSKTLAPDTVGYWMRVSSMRWSQLARIKQSLFGKTCVDTWISVREIVVDRRCGNGEQIRSVRPNRLTLCLLATATKWHTLDSCAHCSEGTLKCWQKKRVLIACGFAVSRLRTTNSILFAMRRNGGVSLNLRVGSAYIRKGGGMEDAIISRCLPYCLVRVVCIPQASKTCGARLKVLVPWVLKYRSFSISWRISCR